MGKIFDAINKDNQQPPLKELADLPEINGSLPAEEYDQNTPALSKDMNAKWILALKKIIGKITLEEMEHKQALSYMFTGLCNGVGTSTICHQAIDLLAEAKGKRDILFLDCTCNTAYTSDRSFVDELLNKTIPIEQLMEKYDTEGGVTRLTLNLSEQKLKSAIIPQSIHDFIVYAHQAYNWIIIDAPPFYTSPIMFSLARTLSGIVLIAEAGSTRLPSLKMLTEECEELNIPISGVILNKRTYPIPRFLLKFI